MAYAEKHGKGWRARYLKPDGSYGSEPGFRTKKAAQNWGNAEEEKVRNGRWTDPKLAKTPFEDWVADWLEALDLAVTSMDGYPRTIRTMILPFFTGWEIGRIRPLDVGKWEKYLREQGYKPSSIATAHARLHTLLEDAVENGYLPSNPATRRRRRGKHEDREDPSTEEEVWTTPLGALLVAERCGVLGGRDEDFLLPITLAYTGMRLGEAIGLEQRYCRAKLHGLIRVEWQMVEVGGRFHRRPPKLGSRRNVPLPPFLRDLLVDQLAAHPRNRCRCEEPHTEGRPQRYVFLGRDGGHHRRSNFYRRQFTPATDGKRPPDGGTRKPVYVELEEVAWPGRPVVGRGNEARAEAAWLPIALDLTPHGLRHSHTVWMDEDNIPEVAQFERLGHRLSGIRGVYAHPSDDMRAAILAGLQKRWKASLRQRAAIYSRSPVKLLDKLLEPYREDAGRDDLPIFSHESENPLPIISGGGR